MYEANGAHAFHTRHNSSTIGLKPVRNASSKGKNKRPSLPEVTAARVGSGTRACGTRVARWARGWRGCVCRS